MRKSVGIVLVAARLVASQGQNATAYTGPGPYPPRVSAFSNANTAGSKTVPFELWYPSESDAPAPTWSWETRIETAEISDSNIANAQQLAQVYNLQWGSGSLADAVGQHAGQLDANSFCVTVVESLFPKGTTNNYNDDTEDNASDGSCTKPLRKRCTEAIQSAFQKADEDANGCRGGTLDLSNIKECDWSFEHTYQAATYNLLRNSTAHASVNGSFPLHSGDGFAYIATDVYDATNRTFFHQAEGRLQMIIIDSGTVYTPLCVRVNNKEKARGEATGALGNHATVATGNVNFWLAAAAAFVGLSYML